MNNNTYALSYYVDLRLGLIYDVVVTPRAAYNATAARFGCNAADYAAHHCDETSKD